LVSAKKKKKKKKRDFLLCCWDLLGPHISTMFGKPEIIKFTFIERYHLEDFWCGEQPIERFFEI